MAHYDCFREAAEHSANRENLIAAQAEIARLRRALQAIDKLRGMCIYADDPEAREGSAAAFAQAADLARCALDDPKSFMLEVD